MKDLTDKEIEEIRDLVWNATKIDENKNLKDLTEQYGCADKLHSVFLFNKEKRLFSVDTTDLYYVEELSVEDLKKLSQYFLKVANYMEKKK